MTTCGPISARIRQEAAPRRELVLWMTWATTVANLGYSDMRSEVEALNRDGLFPEGDFTREEFDLRIARAQSDASGLAGFRYDLVAPLEDASAALLSLDQRGREPFRTPPARPRRAKGSSPPLSSTRFSLARRRPDRATAAARPAPARFRARAFAR